MELGVNMWFSLLPISLLFLTVFPITMLLSFFVNPMSAYLMSTKCHTPQKGEYLLQTAAGSALGKLVIQLGKILGFKTINIVRSESNKSELLSLGADEVIVTSTEKIPERVAAITGGKGVKYAIDCVGGEQTSEILQSMAFKGKLIIYGQLANEDIHFKSGLLVVKLLTIEGFWLSDWAKSAPPEERKQYFQGLMELFAAKKLDCAVGKEFELKDFAEAFKASADSKAGGGGKVMLKCS